jgi:hypothetical protein
MAAYCVSYDLNKVGQNYSALYEELKNSASWWHYLDSTWLIYTQEGVHQLTERIRRHMDDNDRLVVAPIRRPIGGWLPQDAWDWINNYVPL